MHHTAETVSVKWIPLKKKISNHSIVKMFVMNTRQPQMVVENFNFPKDTLQEVI